MSRLPIFSSYPSTLYLSFFGRRLLTVANKSENQELVKLAKLAMKSHSEVVAHMAGLEVAFNDAKRQCTQASVLLCAAMNGFLAHTRGFVGKSSSSSPSSSRAASSPLPYLDHLMDKVRGWRWCRLSTHTDTDTATVDRLARLDSPHPHTHTHAPHTHTPHIHTHACTKDTHVPSSTYSFFNHLLIFLFVPFSRSGRPGGI